MITELFQEGDGSDTIKLMQYRIIESEKLTAAIFDELKTLNTTLAQIDKRLALTDKRLADHSGLIKALRQEDVNVRMESKEVMRDMHNSIKQDIETGIVKASSKGSQSAFWTGVTAMGTAISAIVYTLFKGPSGP